MVDLLKDELKKVLRSRMNPVVDSVCLDFEESVARDVAQTEVEHETTDFNRYYACCQHLIEYISKTMDTSPAFVEKMNYVVLASRCNATKSMLETVLKQDVRFQRRGADDVAKKQSTTKDSSTNLTPKPQLLEKTKLLSDKLRSNDHLTGYSSADSCESDGYSSDESSLQHELDELQRVEVYADETQEDETSTRREKHEDVGPASELCLLKPQSPGQLETITQWIQNTNKVVDAEVCEPPEGYFCSRDCGKAREDMNTGSELRRVFQSVGAHLEKCHSARCELKTRVELRHTAHLVELKQLNICEIRRKLRDIEKNVSMGVDYDDEDQQVSDSEIETLENDLQANKDELVVLENRKLSLCTMMDSIRLDWRDEVVDSVQPSHYVRWA
ncbi:hypothetical protein KRP22_005431 [Phytophthora ramorum]|nr:hypothetical protein KRP22_3438 [Phytophthora ramorum]